MLLSYFKVFSAILGGETSKTPAPFISSVFSFDLQQAWMWRHCILMVSTIGYALEQALVKPVITHPREAQWLGTWWDFYFSNHPFSSTLIWWHNLLDDVASLEHLQRCSVCDLGKLFFTSKFSYFIFCNPTHETETGTANRWGTTNSKLPGPIIMMAQSETLISSQILFVTLVSAGAQSCCAFYQTPQTVQLLLSQNHFRESNQQVSYFHLFQRQRKRGRIWCQN